MSGATSEAKYRYALSSTFPIKFIPDNNSSSFGNWLANHEIECQIAPTLGHYNWCGKLCGKRVSIFLDEEGGLDTAFWYDHSCPQGVRVLELNELMDMVIKSNGGNCSEVELFSE